MWWLLLWPYRGGTKKMDDRKRGKNDLLWAQYVGNKYFDTVELKGPRAPIISTKKKKMFATYWGHGEVLFAPVCGHFFGSHFGWAPQNFMAVYFVPPL